MADFLAAFERGIQNEGGYRLTNINGDRGGQTYAGISRAMNPNWEGWGSIDKGQIPPSSLVRDFYRREFWDRISGDDLQHQDVAASLYDFAINAGWSVAAKLAQTVAGVTPDGQIGPASVAALNSVDPHLFKLAYALAKVQRYADIVNRNRGQGRFLLGWINRTLEGLK